MISLQISFVVHSEYTLPEYCDDIYVNNGQIFAVVPQVVGCLITQQNFDTIVHFYDYLGWKISPQVIQIDDTYWLVMDKYNKSCGVFKVDLSVQKNVLLQQQAGNYITLQGQLKSISVDQFRKLAKSIQPNVFQDVSLDSQFQTMLQTKSHDGTFVNSQPCPWYEEEEEEEQENNK